MGLFEHFGLDKSLFPKKLIDSCRGDLLIVGGGRCVWEDVRGLPLPSAVMTVNDMIMYWPEKVTHAYSNDTEQLDHWSAGRRRRHVQQFGTGWKLHSCFSRPHLPHIHHWPFPGQGSSGLVALLVALGLGYAPITVAGLPFNDEGHFFDPPNDHNLRKDGKWSNFTGETPDRLIKRTLPVLKGKVRAMSGRLKDFLDG